MKTNRRGFFGLLVGLAAGVYAAFQKNEAKANPIELEAEDYYFEIVFTDSTATNDSFNCRVYKNNGKDGWELVDNNS